MKIRTDFVTNSSSSGYVVISIKKTNGETIETQSEYSAGFGGYFWNTRNPEAELNVSFLNARNGEDILKVLRDHIN